MTRIQKCLSENIRFYRKQAGLTQAQLAEKVDSSTNYISTIELGKKFPSPTMIEKLAKIFNIESPLLFLDRNGATLRTFGSCRYELIKNVEQTIIDTLDDFERMEQN
jgi:transcriptional regulator with XRE-family HTH domain